MIMRMFGISAGMATGTLVFNLVAEFYVINANYLVLALAVGCAAGGAAPGITCQCAHSASVHIHILPLLLLILFLHRSSIT